MSAADDALDRLERDAPTLSKDVLQRREADLATVRDGLQRLRDERDRNAQRAEAAEDAERSLCDEIERLEAEVRQERQWRHHWQNEESRLQAEVRRLTEGLELISRMPNSPHTAANKARALLADSPPDGGGAK